MNLVTSGRKLVLNKITLQRLTDNEMSHIQGGFTYSLSTGDICQDSNARWQNILMQYGTVAPVVTGTGANTEPSQMEQPSNGYECTALPPAPAP